MLNVFIIEQTPFFRLGIKYFLEKEFADFSLTDFGTLQESKSSASSGKPDLIFLGIDTDFTELSRLNEVKKLYQDSSLIVCDPDAKAETGIRYLRLGAKGYLSKRSDMAMLGICVRTVLEGKYFLEPTYLQTLIMGLKINEKHVRKSIHFQDFSLSHRQHEIALLLAQGMTTSEIAIRLGIHTSTVSTIKSALYLKLNIQSIIGLKKILGINP